MAVPLVADRFTEASGVWRDLATGRAVTVAVHDVGRDWPARERRLDAGWMTARSGQGTLVDFGRLGTRCWFEAWGWWRGLAPPRAPGRLDEVVRQLLASIDRSAVGFQIVEAGLCPAPEHEWLMLLLGRALRRIGFVPVRASHWSPSGLAASCMGRHVALLWPEDEPGDWTVDWIRRLGAQSTRQHLLVRIRAGPWRAQTAAVREAAAGYGNAKPTSGSVAALARARSLLARAEMDGCLALLASVRAACAARGQRVPDAWRGLDVQVHFWLGRFGTARALSSGLAREADRTGWMGLLSWALFDPAGIEHQRGACARLAGEGDRRAAFWDGLLAWLTATGRESGAGRANGGEWRLQPPDDLRIIAEAAVMEQARALCGGGPESEAGGRARPPDLRGLVSGWLASTRRAGDWASEAARPVLERGAMGVLRWGQRRADMRILHLVPGLLQVVHDAEDERVALDAACAWVRTHAGARGVAVVAAGGGEVVAQAGWSERRVRNEVHSQVCRETPHTWSDEAGPGGPVQVTAPVRYAGAIIGHVLAAGSREEAEMVEDGVQALAALCGPALRARLDALAVPNDPSSLMPELIGRSAVMTAVCEQVRQAARTGFPVLIEGESGTGKELVARALHRLSDRRSRRLMAVNCAALTDDLVEAELFGFARGAFTGAVTARAGLFEDAHRGSLFLDEVSELSARAQAKLLRALQEREVRRVGENTARAVDVRVIAATNQPLAEAAASRRFREDLLFRLAVLRIALPPLRDRLEDLPALSAAFWRRAMEDVGKRARLTREAVAALCGYDWPGNVRELQNVLAGLAVRAPARGRLDARQVRAHLSGAPAAASMGVSLEDLRRQCERRAVAGALARHGGRRAPAARELGLSRQGLSKAIRRLGLESAEEAAGVA